MNLNEIQSLLESLEQSKVLLLNKESYLPLTASTFRKYLTDEARIQGIYIKTSVDPSGNCILKWVGKALDRSEAKPVETSPSTFSQAEKKPSSLINNQVKTTQNQIITNKHSQSIIVGAALLLKEGVINSFEILSIDPDGLACLYDLSKFEVIKETPRGTLLL